MPEYIAECFWSGVRSVDLDRLDERARSETARRTGVQYLGSTLVPDDEVVFCFFSGKTAAHVREVAERAKIPFARIVASKHYRPAGDGEHP